MTHKKGKTTKNARRWTGNELELFADVLADPENNFAISLEELVLRKSANYELFKHIKNTFEMEMDNSAKLGYTNYGKNINDSPSFIQNYYL